MYKPSGLARLDKQTLTYIHTLCIPKSLLALFFTLNICFGYNFGFTRMFKTRILRLGAKLISIIISLSVLGILISGSIKNHNIQTMSWWSGFITLQYLILLLITNFSKYNIFDFLLNISEVDSDVPVVTSEVPGILVFLYTLVMFLTKYLLYVTHCLVKNEYICSSKMMTSYLYALCFQGLDMFSVVLIIIYFYVNSYVRKLRTLIENGNIDPIKVRKYYMHIAGCHDKIRVLADRLIITEMVFEIPKLMILIYALLIFIKDELGWFVYITEAVFIIHIIVRMFASSIMAEVVLSNIDGIKKAMDHVLLTEEDPTKYHRMRRLQRYMKSRNLEHKVWRIIPVDMRLPFSVLSICATYLIVAVQFSHLYD